MVGIVAEGRRNRGGFGRGGATGSVAGQIAKIAGARVVGIAGGPEKCKAVVEDFGFDACIDTGKKSPRPH